MRALLHVQAAAAPKPAGKCPLQGSHTGIDWEIWGELGFCLDMQAVDSQKYKQLEAEGATVRNSLSVFLEDAAVSEQSEEPL